MTATGIESARLQSLIARIERLESEKAEIASDIKDIYAEAKSAGFDVKIMRQVVRLRTMDAKEREEQEQLREVYMDALTAKRREPELPMAEPEERDGRVNFSPIPDPHEVSTEDDADERGAGDGWSDIEPETAKAIGRAISDRDPPPSKIDSAVERLKRGMNVGAGA